MKGKLIATIDAMATRNEKPKPRARPATVTALRRVTSSGESQAPVAMTASTCRPTSAMTLSRDWTSSAYSMGRNARKTA